MSVWAILYLPNSDAFVPVQMRKVTAGPADSGGVNDWSHLSGRQSDHSALLNDYQIVGALYDWSTICISTEPECARQYITFKRRF